MKNTLQSAVAYARTSTSEQRNERQYENVKRYAEENGHEIIKCFQDSITGRSDTSDRTGFNKMLTFIKKNSISTVYFSEISRVGRRVSDVISTIELLVEEYDVTIHIQHPNNLTFKADSFGNIDILQKSMLMMLSLGAEMELHYQSVRRLEGIEIAKREGKYKGRVKGSSYSRKQYLEKHSDIVGLLVHSTLPDTKIATTLGKGLSTVKRVKRCLN